MKESKTLSHHIALLVSSYPLPIPVSYALLLAKDLVYSSTEDGCTVLTSFRVDLFLFISASL